MSGSFNSALCIGGSTGTTTIESFNGLVWSNESSNLSAAAYSFGSFGSDNGITYGGNYSATASSYSISNINDMYITDSEISLKSSQPLVYPNDEI